MVGPGKGLEGRRRQVAFYGGSFTGVDPSLQRKYLSVAGDFLRRGWIDSIRVSVRPDELQPDRMAFLREQGVGTVEVGVQSLSDPVLRESRRGCTASQALEAIRRVKEHGLEAGAQIMAGLPGDTGRECMETVRLLCDVRPDFVRIYPLLVLRGTEVARWFRDGRYRPLDLSAAVGLCARMLKCFRRASIPVIRIGLQDEEGMRGKEGAVLAGPAHPAFGFLVKSFLYREEVLRVLAERRVSNSTGVGFRIHPHDRPLFSGHGGENIRLLRQRIGTENIPVDEDPRMPRGRVEIMGVS
jgi:histone acetyltransferase (RNA polymerase elongator complex component)